jgi:two-component system cell cycle sensor histidine kinase/response regulator CckA
MIEPMDTNFKKSVLHGMPDLCGPIADASPIPLAALEGADHIIHYVNPAFSLLAGKRKEEMIGHPFREVVPADDECLSLLARTYRTAQPETHVEEPSGRWPFYWSYAMWPILVGNGRPLGVILQVTETTLAHERTVAMNQALMLGSVRQHELTEAAETLNARMKAEIAERMLVEEQLHARNIELAASREFAQSIVETVHQPLLVLDTELRVKSANPAFYQCFQTTPENVDGLLLFRSDGGQWDCPELRTLLNEVLPIKKAFENLEIAREFAGVGHKILLVGARQLDHVQMILVNIQDITEQRAAEEALRNTQERLRHAQQMEAIGRLAGGVAHDFNNLLTGILGYSALLLDSLSAPEHWPERDNLQLVVECATRASELTKQLLAFGRRQVLQPKVLTLESVIAELQRMLRRVIGEHIDLLIDARAPRGFIHADPAQIGQVIMNLTLNSRDAMVHGGTLTLETNIVEIAVDSPAEDLKPGRYVVLAVKDTGVGMDKATQAHVFEPFFTTKGQGLGTGLGLATVHGIIQQSGAHIRFSSELGYGTTFRVFFPCVAEPAVLPEVDGLQRPEPLSQAPGGSEVVLVAEDEDTVRKLVRHLLESKGYEVLEARHGGEALAICEKKHQHIDLLLTDVRMPKMGGRELAEKAAQLHPAMRVILMSGYTDDLLIAEGIKVRGTNFLQKPFTSSALLRKIRDVLDGHRNEGQTAGPR